MRIHSESILKHGQREAFLAYRDHLPEFATFIDDIQKIVVESREESIRQKMWDAAQNIQDERQVVNNEIMQKFILGVDITEVYSRPRVTEACMNAGLIGGSAFDLRTG